MFELAVTDFQQFPRPLFKPGFLGEKWPAVDYYVELLGVRNASPFFFAQVKATTAPLQARAMSLPIQVARDKCSSLFKLPGPTYLVGVHEPSKRVFILSLHTRPTQGVYNIPLRHELTPANLKILHDEVAGFWKSSQRKPEGSHFV